METKLTTIMEVLKMSLKQNWYDALDIGKKLRMNRKGFLDQTVGAVVSIVVIIAAFMMGAVFISQIKALPVITADACATAAIVAMQTTYYTIPGWVGILLVVFFMVLVIGAIMLLRARKQGE